MGWQKSRLGVGQLNKWIVWENKNDKIQRFNVEETRQNIFQLKYNNGNPKDLVLRLKDLMSKKPDKISFN